MNIIEALKKLRDDLRTWARNNFKNVLEKQKATDDKVVNLENKTSNITEDESAALQFADPEGNVVAQIDESGISTVGVKVNGKAVALQEDLEAIDLLDTEVKLQTELKTYYNVGKVTTASGTNPVTIGNAGDSLRNVFDNLFNMDETQPSITANPSITLTLSSTASDEYGTKIKSLSYSISTEDGAYTNDNTTGVTWSGYNFTGSGFSEPSTTFTSKTGTVTLSSDYEVGVSSAISLIVEGTHTAGNVAKTNLGNNSDPEIKIVAGTKTDACTFSKSSKYYDYSVLTTGETAPTTGLTRQTSSGANATYSYAKDQYLYLYSRSSGKKIQTNVLGQWADVNTTQIGEVKITLSSGATNITYYAYRTDKFADAGSAQYKLV